MAKWSWRREASRASRSLRRAARIWGIVSSSVAAAAADVVVAGSGVVVGFGGGLLVVEGCCGNGGGGRSGEGVVVERESWANCLSRLARSPAEVQKAR